jgi:hypothetical protein
VTTNPLVPLSSCHRGPTLLLDSPHRERVLGAHGSHDELALAARRQSFLTTWPGFFLFVCFGGTGV